MLEKVKEIVFDLKVKATVIGCLVTKKEQLMINVGKDELYVGTNYRQSKKTTRISVTEDINGKYTNMIMKQIKVFG